MDKGKHINIIELEFVSYACISLKIEVCANNLSIEWEDGKIEKLKSENGYYYIRNCFDTEGLRTLKLIGKNITFFKASRIGLIEISFKNCNNLRHLDCSCNELLSLDISECLSLEELYCNNNNILFFRIPAENNLIHLNISHNNIQELYLKNCKGLKSLYCQNNKIIDFDINGCISLAELNISENLVDENSINDFGSSSVYPYIENCDYCQQKAKK